MVNGILEKTSKDMFGINHAVISQPASALSKPGSTGAWSTQKGMANPSHTWSQVLTGRMNHYRFSSKLLLTGAPRRKFFFCNLFCCLKLFKLIFASSSFSLSNNEVMLWSRNSTRTFLGVRTKCVKANFCDSHMQMSKYNTHATVTQMEMNEAQPTMVLIFYKLYIKCMHFSFVEMFSFSW